MKPLPIILMAVLALGACRPAKHLVETTTTEHVDVRTTKVPRDTLIPVPKEMVHQELILETPTPVVDVAPQTRSNGRAISTLQVKDGRVVVDCICDTASIKARLWDIWTKETRDKQTVTKETIIKYRTPAWCWWLLAALVVIVIWKLLPIILKVIKPL